MKAGIFYARKMRATKRFTYFDQKIVEIGYFGEERTRVIKVETFGGLRRALDAPPGALPSPALECGQMATGQDTSFDFPLGDYNRTAHHEAGHAVLMLALRLGCKGVSIVPDYAALEAGSATHGGEWGDAPAELGEQGDEVYTLRTVAEEAFFLRHAIVNLAGAEAVRRWKPERDDWKAEADHDYRQALFRINDITDDPSCMNSLYAYAERRCSILIEHYWPEICAIAKELVERKKLSGKRVHRFFFKSIKARGAGLPSW